MFFKKNSNLNFIGSILFAVTVLVGGFFVSNTVFATVTITVEAQSPNPVVVGNSATYVISVVTAGTSTARDVSLTVSGLPTGVGSSISTPLCQTSSTSTPATWTVTITTNVATTPPGNYNFTVVGSRYNLSDGTCTSGKMPSGSQPSSQTPSLVISAPVPTVSSVSSIADMSVANGTALNAVELPSNATVTLSDSTTPLYAVTWDGGSPIYNSTTAGTYVFTGTLTLPGGVFNPSGVNANMNVIVAVPSATLDSIAITHAATKLSYFVGESLDTAGLVITGTYSDTTTAVVTPDSVTGFDNLVAVPSQILTVNYGGKTTTYTVAINEIVPPEVTLSSIEITTPATKLSYTVGDTLDISGLVVTGTYSDASHQVETITSDNISGFDSSVVIVSQILTINYEGKTTTYTIVINEVASPTNTVSHGSYIKSATPATGQVLGIEKFNFTKFLKFKVLSYKVSLQGIEVMELQKLLNNYGDTLIIDGKFGPKTKGAVIKFQLANGLKGDGIIGALTRAVLNK